MKILLFFSLLFKIAWLSAQTENCDNYLAYFPLYTKQLVSGDAKYDRVNIHKMNPDQSKAYNKVKSKLEKALGVYSHQLKIDRIREAVRSNNKNEHFVYRCRVNIEGFNYGFEIGANAKGKITSSLPFAGLKKRIGLPCEALQRAEAQVNFKKAVGIKLVFKEKKAYWEIWEEGKSLSAEHRKVRGIVSQINRTEHQVMTINPKTLEILGSHKEILERF